jgi:hypothetical protein
MVTLLEMIVDTADSAVCRVCDVPWLAGMSPGALRASLRQLVHDGQLVILGDLHQQAQLWVTEEGFRAVEAARAARRPAPAAPLQLLPPTAVQRRAAG